MRKIIQLVVSSDNKLIGLCNDGTVWIKKSNLWEEINTYQFDAFEYDQDEHENPNDPLFYKWDDRD